MGLIGWSWVFLAFYVGLMIAFGIIGHRKVSNADEFATARGGYGPIFLAFAFAATTASGATFVGFPGIVYNAGLPGCLLYTSPSPRDATLSRMPSSA